jgi:hypothetical protein
MNAITKKRAVLTSARCGKCKLRLQGPLHEPHCTCLGNLYRRPTVETLLRTWQTDRRPLWQRAMLVLRHPGALDELTPVLDIPDLSAIRFDARGELAT